jgi:hypothetical protein
MDAGATTNSADGICPSKIRKCENIRRCIASKNFSRRSITNSHRTKQKDKDFAGSGDVDERIP